MKYISLCSLFIFICSLVYAEQITMDLNTATDLNGNPIVYSQSPIAYTYYDLTHVWKETYNDSDSCRHILVNDGVFRLSHLPSGMAYGGMSWEGFTLSTVSQDTANVFGCVANGGLAGVGTPYVIGYYSEWVSASQGYSSNIIDFNEEYYPEYVYICQNSNTMEGITNGVFNSRPFTQEDTLTLIIQSLDSTMQPTATSTYYLAVDGQKNNTWVQVSLAGLGKTSRLSFSMTTTDMGDWGANTPMYFALDALTVNTNPLTAVPSVNSHNTNQQTRLISQHNNIFILRNQELFTLDGRKVH
jgi:hypothetical protein